MKKVNKSLVVLLAITMVLTVGMASAASTTDKIAFNLTKGAYTTDDYATNTYTSVPASAVFNGNIRTNGNDLYLSPLTGTITINGTDYNIQIKGLKQSEPILAYTREVGTPGSGYYSKWESWYSIVEVNIGGDKYMGTLNWFKEHAEYGGTSYDYVASQLSFNGILDGKTASASIWANSLPQIG